MSDFAFKPYNEYEVTVRVSDLSKLESENVQLKQQLETYKESDKVLNDTLESRENEILKLKKQLKEAVEVIEFQKENYGNGMNTHVGLIDIVSEFREALGE